MQPYEAIEVWRRPRKGSSPLYVDLIRIMATGMPA